MNNKISGITEREESKGRLMRYILSSRERRGSGGEVSKLGQQAQPPA